MIKIHSHIIFVFFGILVVTSVLYTFYFMHYQIYTGENEKQVISIGNLIKQDIVNAYTYKTNYSISIPKYIGEKEYYIVTGNSNFTIYWNGEEYNWQLSSIPISGTMYSTAKQRNVLWTEAEIRLE